VPKDIAASVRQRLLNLAKERKEDFSFILTKYGIERMLYRISQSVHVDKFVLKGATLFAIWTDTPHRPTRDMAMLGFFDNDVQKIRQIFKEISSIKGEDGIEFDIHSTN